MYATRNPEYPFLKLNSIHHGCTLHLMFNIYLSTYEVYHSYHLCTLEVIHQVSVTSDYMNHPMNLSFSLNNPEIMKLIILVSMNSPYRCRVHHLIEKYEQCSSRLVIGKWVNWCHFVTSQHSLTPFSFHLETWSINEFMADFIWPRFFKYLKGDKGTLHGFLFLLHYRQYKAKLVTNHSRSFLL